MPFLGPREPFLQDPQDLRDNAQFVHDRLAVTSHPPARTSIYARFRLPFHQITIFANINEQYALFDGSQVVVPRALLERLPEITPAAYYVGVEAGPPEKYTFRLNALLDYGPLDDAYYQMYHQAKIISKYTMNNHIITQLMQHARAVQLPCLLFKTRLYIVYPGELSRTIVETRYDIQSDLSIDEIDFQARIPFDESIRALAYDV